MRLSDIPEVQFDHQGVTFHYLVFRLVSGGEERTLVRGENYRPYEPDATQQIINSTLDHLESAGFDEDKDRLEVDGGGTMSLNPYYETVVLFGEDSEYGEESDRAGVAEKVRSALPGLEISWFASGEEPQPPSKKPPERPSEKRASE